MEFSDFNIEKKALIDEFSQEQNVPVESVKVVASPYRVCPLGAHIDHQGGPVLGMTVNAYTLMAYTPTPNGMIDLRSSNYPDPVAFDLEQIPEKIPGAWGYYARGAALALKEEFDLKKGITGRLNGMLPGCGLSSSASVLLAYLFALTDANDITLKPWDYVRLTQKAENKYIGLKNGILDQTSIVFGKKDHLLHIDTQTPNVEEIPDSVDAHAYRILVAYSGYSRELTTTGYNTRVQECQEAAQALAQQDGTAEVNVLSDISEESFYAHGKKLTPIHHRRAAHFFGEVKRVQDGLSAWKNGELVEFGRLMNESCLSSIELYECGSEAVHDLQRIVSSTEGVWGSRFSGGGFGGCVVGLVEPACAEIAVSEIKEAYLKLHPETSEHAEVYLATSVEGVHFP